MNSGINVSQLIWHSLSENVFIVWTEHGTIKSDAGLSMWKIPCTAWHWREMSFTSCQNNVYWFYSDFCTCAVCVNLYEISKKGLALCLLEDVTLLVNSLALIRTVYLLFQLWRGAYLSSPVSYVPQLNILLTWHIKETFQRVLCSQQFPPPRSNVQCMFPWSTCTNHPLTAYSLLMLYSLKLVPPNFWTDSFPDFKHWYLHSDQMDYYPSNGIEPSSLPSFFCNLNCGDSL